MNEDNTWVASRSKTELNESSVLHKNRRSCLAEGQEFIDTSQGYVVKTYIKFRDIGNGYLDGPRLEILTLLRLLTVSTGTFTLPNSTFKYLSSLLEFPLKNTTITGGGSLTFWPGPIAKD
nr:unnamed protein product [Callosobruchus chinensis]